MVRVGSRANENLDQGKYVYFISDETAIKIGKSDAPLKRLDQLQTGNPRQLILLGTSHLLDEETVQSKFAEFRVRGEWFEQCNDVITYCENNKTQHYDLFRMEKKELVQMILDVRKKNA